MDTLQHKQSKAKKHILPQSSEMAVKSEDLELAAGFMTWDELAHGIMILETATIYTLDKSDIAQNNRMIKILEKEKNKRLHPNPVPISF